MMSAMRTTEFNLAKISLALFAGRSDLRMR